MTIRLYYPDAYLRTFDATVVAAEDDGRRVYLDRTAFYPTSGGQPHDTGALGPARVLDVVDERDRIAHLLDRPLPLGPVAGTIDWARRFDHMQQHTGQHLLSAVIAELFGYRTTSVHFGAASSTLDLDTPALSHEQVVAAEEQANEVAAGDRPVEVSFEEPEAASALRRPSDRVGTLRIVTIRDLDRSACGGTHVRATGEIGAILLGKVERVRKSVRLEFLCGRRAVRRARADFDLLGGIAAAHSAAPADLPALLEAQRDELRRSAAARRELELALDARRARELYERAEPGPGGIRCVVLREEPGMTPERLRALAQAVTSLPRAVFIGATREPPAVLVASSPDSAMDAGGSLKAVLQAVGGRGGGGERLAQGSVPLAALGSAVDALAAASGQALS